MKSAVALMLCMLAGGDISGQTRTTEDENEVNIRLKGCLDTSDRRFVLIAEAGNTYKLIEGSRKIRLDQHVGSQVEVTGWEWRALSKDATALGNARNNPEAIVVTSIRTIEDSCAATQSSVP